MRWPSAVLDVASYLTEDDPPLDLVTSVRAVARTAVGVLVFDDADGGTHVVPGGRRAPGETPLAALGRELSEETGLAVADKPRRLGLAHFRSLSPPVSPGYPHPDFVHLVYAVELAEGAPASTDAYVVRPRVVSVDEALGLALPVTERVFLVAALGR